MTQLKLVIYYVAYGAISLRCRNRHRLMHTDSIDAQVVKQTLRAIRYAESLDESPLTALAAVDIRMRSGGLPDTVESRAAELSALLDDLVRRELARCRGASRCTHHVPARTEQTCEQMRSDFQRHDVDLEAWSALHYRYFVDLGMREAEVAGRVGISYRTLARRLDRGHGALAALLREEELTAAAALLSRPGRLPSYFSRLIGREDEIRDVTRMLADHRLVTLTGPGGIGKTRLAIEVARRAEQALGDVTFVDLNRLEEPALVPAAVAGAMGVRPDPNQSMLDAAAEQLQQREHLLLLDNCEHVLHASASAIRRLLSCCPALRILATSRELLHLSGEVVLSVPPLPIPDDTHGHTDPRALESASVQLFEDRARATIPAYAVAEGNADAVLRLCRRLDGIPLALELAAHRISVLSANQIDAHLDNRFSFLRDGSGQGNARHLTLRATLDWSYDLLTDCERRLFRRVSVFAGGEDLAAATAVCADRDKSADPSYPVTPEAVVELLTALVGKSLLTAERDSSAVRRYHCLPTLQDYARDRLRESGEEELVCRRHAAYFADRAEQLEPELAGPSQAEALSTLTREHDNMRRALGWAVKASEATLGLRLSGALSRYWELQGHIEEGRRWLRACLEMPDAGVRPALRAKALSGAGALAEEQGDFRDAYTHHRESLQIRRAVDDDVGIAESLNNLGNVLNLQADYEAARARHLEALEIRLRQEDAWGVAVSLNNLGNVSQHLGRLAEAREYYSRSVTAFRDLGDRWALSAVINNLGVVACDEGDYDAARAHLEESLRIAADLGDRHGEAYALHNLGDVALHQGRGDDARALQAESLSIVREVGDEQGVAESLESFAALAHFSHADALAAELLGAAHALRERIGAPSAAGEATEMQERLRQLRETLGDESFTVSWDAGTALTEAEAEALVRGI